MQAPVRLVRLCGMILLLTSNKGVFMESENSNPLEQQYPRVDLAYPMAVSSYDTAMKRSDTIDGKLQTILAFVAVVTVAVPSIANARGVSFASYWFYFGLLFFISIVVIGIYARLTGAVRVISPDLLFEDWLHKTAWEFKKDFIAFAGNDFNHNLKLINYKWKLATLITVLFFFQVACLAAWVLGIGP